MAVDIKDIQDAFEYDKNGWQDIRREAAKDMRYVAGDPFDATDKAARANRPTVAPDELSQYRNQVVNGLMSNPRGVKFSPSGNGASEKTAEFYQNLMRAIEYRSHAPQQYLLAADNALQRSYGFVRVSVGYQSPREANQDISIEGFPNPDMVMPDSDALMPDSSDMKRCWVYKWIQQTQFKTDWPKAKVTNFGDFSSRNPDWIQGNKVLIAEHWREQTRKRVLLLVQPPPMPGPTGALVQSPPMQVFRDELHPGDTVLRELREVDYPEIWLYLTNGLEILHEQMWMGKHIPIVSCYGKTLYVPDGDNPTSALGRTGTTVKGRQILSMTRFGRDPWKAYCYACSQELEILGQIPKASVVAYEGQLAGHEDEWEESLYTPKAWLYAKHTVEGIASGQPLPLPQRLAYMQGEYLQGLEVVKEGWRRAIQAAMGSNFLPTEAQRINDKSGVALDRINQAATVGTYHFVFAFEAMIRRVGVIVEDLIDKVHDYRGEISVTQADGKSQPVQINDPNNPDAISTKGDHLVTVSTAPSSDSEETAVEAFTDQLVGQLGEIAQIQPGSAAGKVLATSIRMRNLGPKGDQLADYFDPPVLGQDGEPVPPQMQALMQQAQQLQQENQHLKQTIQSRMDVERVKQDGDYRVADLKARTTSADKAADRAVKLDVAAIQAKIETMAMLFEELQRIGGLHTDAAQRLHEAGQAALDRQHEDAQAVKERLHEHIQGVVDRAHEADMAQQGVAGQLAVQAAQPQPQAGA